MISQHHTLIGSDNGLAPKILSNDGLVYWRAYTSLCLHELMQNCSCAFFDINHTWCWYAMSDLPLNSPKQLTLPCAYTSKQSMIAFIVKLKTSKMYVDSKWSYPPNKMKLFSSCSITEHSDSYKTEECGTVNILNSNIPKVSDLVRVNQYIE